MNIQGDFIARLNWPDIATQLDREGYAVLHSLLKDSQVHELAALRGTACADDRVSLASEGLGRGHWFYFLRPQKLCSGKGPKLRNLSPTSRHWLDNPGWRWRST